MGVSNKTWSTDAYGTMVFDLTVCPNSTGQCKAWVFTFLVYACKMRGAVRVNQAFWLRSWKEKFHASQESLNLISSHLSTTNFDGGWTMDIFTPTFVIDISHFLWHFFPFNHHMYLVCGRPLYDSSQITTFCPYSFVSQGSTVFLSDLRGVHLVCGDPI